MYCSFNDLIPKTSCIDVLSIKLISMVSKKKKLGFVKTLLDLLFVNLFLQHWNNQSCTFHILIYYNYNYVMKTK